MTPLTGMAKDPSTTSDTARARSWPLRWLARRREGAARLGITGRLRLLLFCCVVSPPAVTLYLLETRTLTDIEQVVALWLLLALLLLLGVSGSLCRWLVLADIACLNTFCDALRLGEYSRRLPVPPQGDDEHELLMLKRDLNWLAHHIETRETWLQARLDETHRRRRLFEDLSRTDALTGLFNRRHFDQVLAEQTRQATSCRTGLALLLIDCDAFKSVNDRFGHPAGDAVLASMGRTLRECVREGIDLAFRLGGDEFALLLPNLDGSGAMGVARRVRRRFGEANPYATTASIGVVTLDPALDANGSPQSLLARCDAALYAVKDAGGNGEALAEAVSGLRVENEN